ncbi:hypothetical protein FOZ61_005081 [Perkinsus olseni]|uniref:Protein spinster 3 n=1 Tax=Perkinsus olseni TaxID=32597 RepID=A0A7J6LI89_PEROL|nr:hypothetical protein FOZ61_005081 [Perkinsus olseni]
MGPDPIVHVPVWVDEFAPIDYQTQWMGYVQIAVAGGAMLGYLVAGIVARFGGSVYLTWRFNFFLQAVLFLPLLLGFILTKKKLIDVPIDHFEFGEFASRSLFVCMTFALCALYFVVTGIQYWVMQYCMVIFHVSRIAVVLFFTVVSSTAPTLGVWFGGWSCDKLGGYKGGSQLISLKLSLCFALISAIMAIASSMVTDIETFVGALWICLFAGGSLMPICVGVLMTTVPAYMRSFSSAFSMLIYNLFGYFLAPFLSGVVMDRFGSPASLEGSTQALVYGWRLVTWWSLFGVGFYTIGFFTAEYKSKYRRPRVDSHRQPYHPESLVTPDFGSYDLARQATAREGEPPETPESGTSTSSQPEVPTRDEISYEVARQRIGTAGI